MTAGTAQVGGVQHVALQAYNFKTFVRYNGTERNRAKRNGAEQNGTVRSVFKKMERTLCSVSIYENGNFFEGYCSIVHCVYIPLSYI